MYFNKFLPVLLNCIKSKATIPSLTGIMFILILSYPGLDLAQND